MYCELCEQPAMHFFATATAHSDGTSGPGSSSSSRQFCDAHAKAYLDQQDREMLDGLPRTIRLWQKLSSESVGELELRFAADSHKKAAALQVDLAKTCGADATISEPDEDGWEILLTVPVQVIDQWECENWSRQLWEFCDRHECRPTGFHFGR